MGLFKKKIKESAVIRFLNEADDSYMRMLQFRDIHEFERYCSYDLAVQLLDRIKDNLDIQVGIPKYRHREWKVIQHENVIWAYQKDTTHDNITLKSTLQIPIGDEFHEVWKLNETGHNKYVVVDIIDRGIVV